jgi:drug/metabolite transporter (DMT)-like permease
VSARPAAPAGAALRPPASKRLAGLVLLFSATLWGLSWWPMQALAGLGVQGPALTFMAYGGVGLLGLPRLWHERARWLGRPGQMLMIALMGGWAAASFVMAMTQGDVVREMLLFYLAPAWSVLGGHFLLKEHLGARRLAAVVLAMAGAYLVIRAGGAGTQAGAQPGLQTVPLAGLPWGGPGGVTGADLMALSSSVTFAGNNLATRAAQEIPVASKAIVLMLGCAVISALLLAGTGASLPALSGAAALGVLAFALVWILCGSSTTAYGMSHLEAGRAAVIILAELVAAVASASLVKGRVPSLGELVGGGLILAAAALDVFET